MYASWAVVPVWSKTHPSIITAAAGAGARNTKVKLVFDSVTVINRHNRVVVFWYWITVDDERRMQRPPSLYAQLCSRIQDKAPAPRSGRVCTGPTQKPKDSTAIWACSTEQWATYGLFCLLLLPVIQACPWITSSSSMLAGDVVWGTMTFTTTETTFACNSLLVEKNCIPRKFIYL